MTAIYRRQRSSSSHLERLLFCLARRLPGGATPHHSQADVWFDVDVEFRHAGSVSPPLRTRHEH